MRNPAFFVSLLSLLTGALVTASCEQSPANCTVAVGGSFFALYKKTAFTGTCAADIQTKLNADTRYEIVGAGAYYPINGDTGTPDTAKGAKFALQGELLGDRRAAGGQPAKHAYCSNTLTPEAPDPDKTHTSYALGMFLTDTAPDGRWCDARMDTKALLDFAGYNKITLDANGNPTNAANGTVISEKPQSPVECATEPDPPSKRSYEWQKVRFLSNAAWHGIQFTATLVYSEDGCTGTYEAQGLYPLQACKVAADCYPEGGGAINPDFDVKCYVEAGKTSGYCTQAKLPPSLRQ